MTSKKMVEYYNKAKDFLGKPDRDITEFVSNNPIPAGVNKNFVAKKLANMQRKMRNEKYDEEERENCVVSIELIDELNR